MIDLFVTVVCYYRAQYFPSCFWKRRRWHHAPPALTTRHRCPSVDRNDSWNTAAISQTLTYLPECWDGSVYNWRRVIPTNPAVVYSCVLHLAFPTSESHSQAACVFIVRIHNGVAAGLLKMAHNIHRTHTVSKCWKITATCMICKAKQWLAMALFWGAGALYRYYTPLFIFRQWLHNAFFILQ